MLYILHIIQRDKQPDYGGFSNIFTLTPTPQSGPKGLGHPRTLLYVYAEDYIPLHRIGIAYVAVAGFEVFDR